MRSQLSLEPILLLDLRLEAGYTFAPFGGSKSTWKLGVMFYIPRAWDLKHINN